MFVRGTADDLVQRTYVGGLWSGWRTLGGSLRGHLRKRLRVLTHNVYGLDGNLCRIRAASSAGGSRTRSPPTTSSDPGVLQRDRLRLRDLRQGPAERQHLVDRPLPQLRQLLPRHFPEVNNGFDGGVGIFTLHSIVRFDDWEWRRRAAAESGGRVHLRPIRLSSDLSLDTYVVHLNSNAGDPSGIADAGGSCSCSSCGTRSPALAGSGNPVIVIGDFNIGGSPSYNGNRGSNDIERMLRSANDLWMDAWPRFDGWTYDCASNRLASGCSDRESGSTTSSCQPIRRSPRAGTPSVATRADVKVVRWRTVRERLSDSSATIGANPLPVSDHWGLEAVIEIRDR